MRKSQVFVQDTPAGILEESEPGKRYRFAYLPDYNGPPVSLTMPTSKREYTFERFPPFFDGLLPEGMMLAGLLRQKKIDARDYFSQLMTVGEEMVGAVSVEEAP